MSPPKIRPNFIRAEFAQWEKSRFHICGGQTRAQSVANGLAEAAAADDDWILIHDAARPCLSADSLDRLMDEVGDDSVGGILALPLADALKITDENRIIKSESRDKKYLAQTPQMFRAAILRDALAKLPNADDESAAVESLGLQPKIVLGESRQYKNHLARRPCHCAGDYCSGRIKDGKAGVKKMIRIGCGMDAHQFADGRRLILGGAEIPHHCGLAGHSDADALSHAICDALLGAMAAGDIGPIISGFRPRL